MGQEEALFHISLHTWEDIPQDTLRQIVETAYADNEGSVKKDMGNEIRRNEYRLIEFLRKRYSFRYNEVLGYVEYRPNCSSNIKYMPFDDRVRNRMVIEARQDGLNVWNNDVSRFVMSDMIDSYNPLQRFLERCQGRWDGKDRIRQLADTVPTKNKKWREWFYTWFLAMVNQWSGRRYSQYGNSVAPLLISTQGYNKSTFCKRLLPPELQWGYTDNLQIGEKKQVLLQMSQMLLINLDEFNQISPAIQQGFLKNVIQLAQVKVKRPYGLRVEEFPRLASFIATSNMTDILTDPSGNRRFIGIELTKPIDTSFVIDYEQLYAQALHAISNGEKTYFDEVQTKEIMESNKEFQMLSPAESYFNEFFSFAEKEENEGDTEWLTSTAIFEEIKKKAGSSLRVTSMLQFSRYLANLPGITKKRSNSGLKYLVKRIK